MPRRHGPEGGRNCDEFMVGVAAVLAGAGVEERRRLEVLEVVERLVERLHKAEQDKVAAANRLKGNLNNGLNLNLAPPKPKLYIKLSFPHRIENTYVEYKHNFFFWQLNVFKRVITCRLIQL